MKLTKAQREALEKCANGEWCWNLRRVSARSLVRRKLLEYKRESCHLWRITAKGLEALRG